MALIVFMALLSVGNLCGQHFRVQEERPKETVKVLDYVRGVYILREVEE